MIIIERLIKRRKIKLRTFKKTIIATLALLLSAGNNPVKETKVTKQEKVTTKQKIDQILSNLQKVHASKLGADYLKKSGLDHKKYAYALGSRTYYLVPESMMNTKILGNNTIRDLTSPGPKFEDKTPVLLNKKVLYKYIEMCDALKKMGHNPDNIKITAGHRHPKHNDSEGGAYTSKHITGDALDFDVGDVNTNGTADMEDKLIVYEILNRQVIRSTGGIGKYSWHPHGLHIDVRGYRARWDSFSR